MLQHRQHPSPCICCARSKSVFVSKHNRSLNVTVDDIVEQAACGGTELVNHRTTTTHVILEHCPFCHDTKGKAENLFKLYVQLGGGAYFCHRCGTGGSWFDFKGRLNGNDTSSTPNPVEQMPLTSGRRKQQKGGISMPVAPLPLPPARAHVVYSTRLLDQETQDGPTQALSYLTNERGLEIKTLRKYGVGVHEYSFPSQEKGNWVKTDCITFPWIMSAEHVAYQEKLRGAIPPEDMDPSKNVTRRIKARALENKSWQRLDPAGGGWGFFGFHTIPTGAKEIIVTEGEYDAMAVYQTTKRPAISLPNGCRSLPIEALPLLEEFDKVLLWMDNDGPGQEGAETFAKKIGLGRSYLVRPTMENTGLSAPSQLPKDANEALLQGLNMEKILDDAKLVPHERILNFEDLREEVLHEILHPEQYVGAPVKSLPGFTKLIQGLRPGELTVLTGPTGSGTYRSFSPRKNRVLTCLFLPLRNRQDYAVGSSFSGSRRRRHQCSVG